MGGARKIGKLATEKDARVALSDRDRVLLRALAKGRILRTADVVALDLFPSVPVARRRLRRLAKSGLLECHTPDYTTDNLYVPTQRGLAQIAGTREADGFNRPERPMRYAENDHHFAGVRFWANLLRYCKTSSELKLQMFQFEHECAAAGILSTNTSYRPDALFRLLLASSGRSYSFLVEVDCATESPTHVEAHKFQVFSRTAAARLPIWDIVPDVLLVLAPSMRRLRALSRAGGPHAAPILGALADQDSPEMPADTGWYRLDDMPPAGAAGRSLPELLGEIRVV